MNSQPSLEQYFRKAQCTRKGSSCCLCHSTNVSLNRSEVISVWMFDLLAVLSAVWLYLLVFSTWSSDLAFSFFQNSSSHSGQLLFLPYSHVSSELSLLEMV